MLKQTIAEYPCSQKELYAVCRTAWSNFKKFDLEFIKAKGFYTSAFADIALAQVNEAEAMPNPISSNEVAEMARIMLEAKAEVCKKNFSKLKVYINASYDDDLEPIMQEEAGLAFYKEATNQNWDAVHDMNVCMMGFLSSHLAKLKANTNLPANFELIANKAILSFNEVYTSYKKDNEAALRSDSKIRVNNHLYRKLSVMLKDAQVVFKQYPELTSLFNFHKIIQSFGSSSAKIKGLVTDETDTIVSYAVIKIKYSDEQEIILEVAKDGSYDTGSIKGGNALITVEAEGFMEVHETLDIPKGAIISKNLRLMRAA